MAYFKFHPKAVVGLGYAYDQRNPGNDTTVNGFFEWTDVKNETSPIGATVEYEMSEINNKKQLYEKLSLDISAEAKFGLTGFDASLSWEQEMSYYENSLIFVFSGKKTYNEERIRGTLGLSNIGRNNLKKRCDSKKIKDFLTTSGTDVVTQIVRANVISLVYMFTFARKENKEKLLAHLGVEWSTGNANIDFSKYKKEVDTSLRIYLKGYQANVNSLTPKDARLTAIIEKNSTNLIEVKKVFKAILDDISENDRKTSPIISFSTTPLNRISEVADSDCFDEIDSFINSNQRVNEECINLRELMLQADEQLEIISKYNSRWNLAEFLEGSDVIIKNKINVYNDIKSKISTLYNKIINAKEISEIGTSSIEIPKVLHSELLREPYIKIQSWEIKSSIECSNENGTVTSNIFLKLNILFIDAISEIQIIQDNKVLKSLYRGDLLSIIANDNSTLGLWSSPYSDTKNCWGCMQDQQIILRNSLSGEHKNRESQKKYSIRVKTIDNKHHELSIGNIVQPLL